MCERDSFLKESELLRGPVAGEWLLSPASAWRLLSTKCIISYLLQDFSTLGGSEVGKVGMVWGKGRKK